MQFIVTTVAHDGTTVSKNWTAQELSGDVLLFMAAEHRTVTVEAC
jgi:NADPH-dependent ferric siderophore reductase